MSAVHQARPIRVHSGSDHAIRLRERVKIFFSHSVQYDLCHFYAVRYRLYLRAHYRPLRTARFERRDNAFQCSDDDTCYELSSQFNVIGVKQEKDKKSAPVLNFV